MKKTTLNTILATLIIVGIASALLISTQQNTISNPKPTTIGPIIRNDIVIYPSNLDANQDPLPKNSLSVQQIFEKAEKHMTKEGYDLDEFKPRQLASYNSEGNIDYFFAQYNKETNSWRVAYQKLEPQSVTQDQFYFECYIDMNLDGSLINMHCSRLE